MAGKIGGTAAELAKQAAQAALAEAGGAEPVAKSPGLGWQPPKLGVFRMDEALDRAYGNAANYLNYMLSPEGLVIDVQQQDAQTQAMVLEKETSRVYRAYAGEDMLRLYATQRGGRGVVADGQV